MGDALTTDSDGSEIVECHHGFPVPRDPRKRALLYNRSMDVQKMDRLYEALERGATFRSAAMQARMLPREFEYIWQLGKDGHPTYRKFFNQVMEARGDYATRLQQHVASHAFTTAGVEDGTAMKVLKAEEKGTYIDEREKVADVVLNLEIGKVVLNTEYGDEAEVVHGEVEDAEVVG